MLPFNYERVPKEPNFKIARYEQVEYSGLVDRYLSRIRNDLIGHIWHRVDVAISPGRLTHCHSGTESEE